MLATFLQEAVEETAEQMPEEKTLSFIELILDGGIAGTVVIAILFVLLIVALYIYFERLFAVKAASKTDVNFMSQIKDHVANGNIEAAKIRCTQENSPVARLTAKGVSRIGSPLEDINTAIENAGRLEVYNLEKNVSVLATIAGAGPMIGFLGTVIGMVLAFHELASSSGQAEMGSLAEGIYVAMTTTVAGLIVGIIAYIGYNHLVVKTDKVVHQMEATAVDFLDLLNEPA
ncbi:MotA/TolQ/ExbB proton channel family protein [Mesonia sp.]|uniref:MotA/TolQ/ExbB proton channel family protein n=1 Tax=Mesonia sp. TaxID=1960830 RepID=UPI00175DD65A|nr:MotA/TolQ/ExbB proton channel family protein [Mesonia sp.]HIB38478.1 MotA/TolQ/ExbB proton channel family protein [Mesonia sp.]HIO27138.1 MotA/TolQ/ExbB proton channel family protein [Flavobacteriaceae bacterium]